MSVPVSEFERRALEAACLLAEEQRGHVEPNPTVGAAVIAAGEGSFVVGAHRAYGGPHAEVDALNAARAAGVDLAGATVVVTLEPCSTRGKTGPCTGALIEAGVARVVVGAIDPNPAHAGAGLTKLRDAGLDVVQVDDALGERCVALLGAFTRGLASTRPHVLAKWAVSREGALAPARDADGQRPRAILSGAEAHALVQRWRASLDAIVVGVGTIVEDDPRLTVRGVESLRPLRRVVLDPSLRTPLGARVITSLRDGFDDDESPAVTLIVANEGASEDRESQLVDAGARVLRVPDDADDRPWVAGVFDALCVEGVGRAMVEGGADTLRRAFAADVVDDVAVFLTTATLGADALPALDGAPSDVESITAALNLVDVRLQACGRDQLLLGCRRPDCRRPD